MPHAWSHVLELEYHIRHTAFKRASQRQNSVKNALEEARLDETLLQDHFYSPVSLEAGAAAAWICWQLRLQAPSILRHWRL